MNILSFQEISKMTNSRYSLVMLVSKRAREIVEGDAPLIETDKDNPVSIALDEARQRAIVFTSKEEEEAQRAEWAAREEIESKDKGSIDQEEEE